MSFWENVDFIRESRGFSRKELAYLANFSITSLSTGIIRNSVPAADVAVRLAKALGVSVEYLVNGTNTKENQQVAITAEKIQRYNKHKEFLNDLDALPDEIQSSIKSMVHKISAKAVW